MAWGDAALASVLLDTAAEQDARLAALSGLSARGSDAAAAALRAATADRDPEVASFAKFVLEGLRKQRAGG
jgi:hypothetical protein